MNLEFTCSPECRRIPFYPFNQALTNLLGHPASRRRLRHAFHQASPLLLEAAQAYRKLRINNSTQALLVVEPAHTLIPRVLRQLMELSLSVLEEENDGDLRASDAPRMPGAFQPGASNSLDERAANRDIDASVPPESADSFDAASTRRITLSISSPEHLPPAFHHTMKTFRAACAARGYTLTTDIPMPSGEPFSEDTELSPPPVTDDVTSQEILGIFLSASWDYYVDFLAEATMRQSLPVEIRELALLTLYRSSRFAEFASRIYVHIVKSGTETSRICFLTRLLLGSSAYVHNNLDTASRYFEQLYNEGIDSLESIPREYRRFCWIRIGDLLAKNREYLPEPAESFYYRALEIPFSGCGRLLHIHNRRGLAHVHGIQSRFQEAAALARGAMAEADDLNFVEEGFHCRRILGSIYQMQADRDNALAVLREALEMTEAHPDPSALAAIQNTAGYLSLVVDSFEASLHHFTSALDVLIDDFSPPALQEIMNTLNNLVQLGITANNLRDALRMNRYAHRLATYFSSRRSERHWNLIQSSKYFAYIYFRLGNRHRAAYHLDTFVRNMRDFELETDIFERERLQLLIRRDFTPERIRRTFAIIEPCLDSTLHLQILGTMFYLDLHAATGEQSHRQAAERLAREYGLQRIVAAFDKPASILWSHVNKKIPLKLLVEYVDTGKSLNESQHTLALYTQVHEFSQSIMNEHHIPTIVTRLVELLRRHFEAHRVFLFLAGEHGFELLSETGETLRRPDRPDQEPLLDYAQGLLATYPSGAALKIPASGAPGEIADTAAIFVQLTTQGARKGILVLTNQPEDRWVFTTEDLSLVQNLADLLSLKLEAIRYVSRLEQRSRVDDLTGLLGKSAFEEVFEEMTEQYRRHNRTFSMMLIDGDDFKRINDTYGHLRGDQAIVRMAETIRNSIRKYDKVIRFGGDEFCVFLPGTAEKQALYIASRLREAMADSVCRVSIGVGEYGKQFPTAESFFESVDGALYRAKRAKDSVEPVHAPAQSRNGRSDNPA